MKTTLILFFLFPLQVFSLDENQMTPTFKKLEEQKWNLAEGQKRALTQDKIVSYADVQSLENEQQKMDFKVLGVHQYSCEIGLKKFSQYENYPIFMERIKESHYFKETQFWYLKFEPPFLPLMNLSFNLPRIEKPGSYDFAFMKGLFAGLKGQILVDQPTSDTCLYSVRANWQGKKTGFPSFLLEMAAESFARKSLEKLFRIGRP